MNILETERLLLREAVETDAEFILDLLNQPTFIKYIGDRGVDNLEKAREAIENKYRQSYRENGFGLWIVVLKETESAIGFCGFVRRESLPGDDLGFAFLPQFEKKGFAFESADAAMKYGREKLNFGRVYAITTQNNANSIKLLGKLGFEFEKLIKLSDGDDELNLYSAA